MSWDFFQGSHVDQLETSLHWYPLVPCYETPRSHLSIGVLLRCWQSLRKFGRLRTFGRFWPFDNESAIFQTKNALINLESCTILNCLLGQNEMYISTKWIFVIILLPAWFVVQTLRLRGDCGARFRWCHWPFGRCVVLLVRETAATLMYIGKFMGGPQKNYLLHGYQFTLHIDLHRWFWQEERSEVRWT